MENVVVLSLDSREWRWADGAPVLCIVPVVVVPGGCPQNVTSGLTVNVPMASVSCAPESVRATS